MSVKSRLKDDMKQAMRSGDKARLGVVRMALAAIQQREVDERAELDEAAVLGVIEKMVKQRRESVEQYRAGGRDDLADKEAAMIDAAIAETGAASMKDMGRVMALLRGRAQGRADMAALSAQVKSRLNN